MKTLEQILSKLKQSFINDICFNSEPVEEVMIVCKAVMIVLGEEETWDAVHHTMEKFDFL
jgi:hypothetical protein